MELRPGLIRTTSLDVEATRREANHAGCTTFVLPAEDIVDRVSFFNAVRTTLPLDPPVMGARSWDAMSDSLWEGLYALPDQRIVILWPNARAMAKAASTDFEIALNVLTDVATSLANPHATRGNPKELTVIIGEA